MTIWKAQRRHNLLVGCSPYEPGDSRRSVRRKASTALKGLSKKKETSLSLEEPNENSSVDLKRVAFEARYEQQNQLGEGGCGTVYAGYRKADNLPVAIKHIPKKNVYCKHTYKNGKELPTEVAIMLNLNNGTPGSLKTSVPVSMLDWYNLDEELILVLERPVPCVDMSAYNGGQLREDEAKVIMKQLVDAAIELKHKHIFHRDIKRENILIETGSDVPRARLIDFGLGCLYKKHSVYRVFYGTESYTPPEWYINGAYTAEPTTVWQLGILLFEALHKNTFQTPDFLNNNLRISKKLSKSCQHFLHRCLEKDPMKRPKLEELQHQPWLK